MLSIIIPTLNEEKYLPLLLDSIKKQDYNDYEIIVADARSRDRTVDIAKEYGCKVVKGGILTKGRNEGAKAAKGNILFFLDADVVLSAGFLGKSIKEFQKRGLGIAGFKLTPVNGKKVDKFFYELWAVLNGKVFCHAAAAIAVKKEVHDAIKGFDEQIKFIEDYSYTIEAYKISKYGFIKNPVFVSMRRFQKDGRLRTYLKYILGGLYITFIGPIKSDIFKYRFGHYQDKKSN